MSATATPDTDLPALLKVFGDGLYRELSGIRNDVGEVRREVGVVRVLVTETNGKAGRAHERIDDVEERLDDERAERIEDRRHFGVRRTTLIAGGMSLAGAVVGGLSGAAASGAFH